MPIRPEQARALLSSVDPVRQRSDGWPVGLRELDGLYLGLLERMRPRPEFLVLFKTLVPRPLAAEAASRPSSSVAAPCPVRYRIPRLLGDHAQGPAARTRELVVVE